MTVTVVAASRVGTKQELPANATSAWPVTIRDPVSVAETAAGAASGLGLREGGHGRGPPIAVTDPGVADPRAPAVNTNLHCETWRILHTDYRKPTARLLHHDLDGHCATFLPRCLNKPAGVDAPGDVVDCTRCPRPRVTSTRFSGS